MVRILFLYLIFINVLFGIDMSLIMSAVKANPDLLKSEEVQKYLKNNTIYKNSDKNITFIENNITDLNLSENNLSDLNLSENNNSEKNITSPISFIPEEKLIKKIHSFQQIQKHIKLNRFGEKFFYNKNSLNKQILSVPKYYQVNKGDEIIVQILGANNKTLNLIINNNGKINFPFIGPKYVAGMSVFELTQFIKKQLKPTYSNSEIIVNVKVNSFIQVSLSGFVKAPGIYNLNSLSTIKDLLIQANGFGKLGSMRKVYLKRGGKILKIIDFYKLIKNGDIVDNTLLQNGDIIYVPKAKKLIKLSGAVNIKAIYELKNNETLKDLIYFAGGLNSEGSKKFIKIKRYKDNSYTKILYKSLNDKVLLLNGDDVYVYKISELNKDLVYVYGNIEKPGSFEIPKDKLLSTLLKKLVYLKDTYYNYGLLETFDGKIFSFNLNTKNNIKLTSKDKIYIFNKYEVLPEEFVKVSGNVRHQGLYRYLEGMTLKDAINNAGLKNDFYDKKVQVLSYDKFMNPTLKFVNYATNPYYKLKPFDEIVVFSYYDFYPLKSVVINGEVNKQGIYNYTRNMTLKDLISLAGWITDKADTKYIELIRYNIQNNKRVRSIQKLSFDNLNLKLKPYDEITIKRIPNWDDRKIVSIDGEVKYPGNYTIKKGDTLYDVIKRAGGFSKSAYLYGAVFTRESVKQMQSQRLKQMIYKLKKKVAVISASAKGAGEGSLDTKNLIEAIDSLAQQAEKLKPIGRIAITLDKDLEKFKSSNYNITLQDGDKLYIPTRPDSVIVLGEVLTPTAFVYTTNSSIKYINQAGGKTDMADDVYFVVHANGFTEQSSFGFFSKSIKVNSGDVITIPIKISTTTWYGIAKDVTSIVYQLAITAASLKTVGAL